MNKDNMKKFEDIVNELKKEQLIWSRLQSVDGISITHGIVNSIDLFTDEAKQLNLKITVDAKSVDEIIEKVEVIYPLIAQRESELSKFIQRYGEPKSGQILILENRYDGFEWRIRL